MLVAEYVQFIVRDLLSEMVTWPSVWVTESPWVLPTVWGEERKGWRWALCGLEENLLLKTSLFTYRVWQVSQPRSLEKSPSLVSSRKWSWCLAWRSVNSEKLQVILDVNYSGNEPVLGICAPLWSTAELRMEVTLCSLPDCINEGYTPVFQNFTSKDSNQGIALWVWN